MRSRLYFAGLCLLAALGDAPAIADASLEEYAGTYDGHQTEIGAALQLGSDGRFQYYMSYGAVDEMAAGTWAVEGDGIVLDSDPVTAPAFALAGSKQGRGSTFDITLDAGQIPIQFFSAVVFFADGTGRSEEFEEARLHLKLERGQAVSAIAFQFPIYDVFSNKIAVPPGTGSMQFRFAPNDLGTVDFDHQLLRRDGDAFVLGRYDRELRFTREEEDAALPVDAPDPVDPMDQVAGDWTYTGQDCDTDNYFEPPADMPGAEFSLSPDHTYRLTRLGKEEHGSFTLAPSEYFNGELFVVTLEQAGLTYIFNIGRLESWSEDAVRTQCTQLFERPAAQGSDGE